MRSERNNALRETTHHTQSQPSQKSYYDNHFPIPLSVTVSKAKKFLVVLFTNDDQTWEMKGEKRTSENRRKINGLEASKNLHEWKFPDTHTSLLRITFLTIF